MWEMLRDLKNHQFKHPCIVGGDFNTIRCRSERSNCRGLVQGSWEFNNFISSCNLVDLPLLGMKFTWFGPEKKCSRLDRVLLDEFWLIHFKDLKQMGLKRFISDHIPLLLANDSVDWGPKPFKFINMWLKEKEFVEVIEKEWEGMSKMHCNLAVKLKRLKGVIKRWHGSNRNYLEDRIIDCEERIKELDVIRCQRRLNKIEVEELKCLNSDLWEA